MLNQSTLDIFLDTEILEMQGKSTQSNCKTLTCWLGDSLVKHFLLVEKDKDSMTAEELSFLKSQGFVKKKDHDIFYLKMLKVSYLTIREELSRQCLGYSPNWGMMLNGRIITANRLEQPKTEKGCILRDILEPNVEEKYYLGKEVVPRLIQN